MKLASIALVLAAAATAVADATMQGEPTATVTTASSVGTVAPAITVIASKPTLAPTTATATQAIQQKAPASSCTEVSVEHDATYCIQGPICSGSGAAPAGTNCPVAGDVAIKDCHSWLPSYTGGKCIAPVSASCQKIKTGAWGCVLDKTTTIPAVTSSIQPTTTPTAAPNGSSSGSLDTAASSASDMGSADNETIAMPAEKLYIVLAATGATNDNRHAAYFFVVALVGAVAAVGAAVTYRKRRAAAMAMPTPEVFTHTL